MMMMTTMMIMVLRPAKQRDVRVTMIEDVVAAAVACHVDVRSRDVYEPNRHGLDVWTSWRQVLDDHNPRIRPKQRAGR